MEVMIVFTPQRCLGIKWNNAFKVLSMVDLFTAAAAFIIISMYSVAFLKPGVSSAPHLPAGSPKADCFASQILSFLISETVLDTGCSCEEGAVEIFWVGCGRRDTPKKSFFALLS